MSKKIGFGSKSPGVFAGHRDCPACGSSDALAIYEHPNEQDDRDDATCFKCSKHYNKDEFEDIECYDILDREEIPFSPVATNSTKLDDVKSLTTPGIPDRRISSETTKRYGVKFDPIGNKRYYPRTKGSKTVGYKCRKLPKEFNPKKGATPVGELKTTEFFGQSLFSSGNVLIITCGEEDAMASFEMTKAHTKNKQGYASVSEQNGHNAIVKTVANNLQWLNGFNRVVFMVDQEEEDIDNAWEACKLLPPGKAFVGKFEENDASDMCAKMKGYEFYKAVWDAESYKPPGIVAGQDTWELYKNQKYSIKGIPLPDIFGLNHCYMGMAKGNLDVIGSFEKAGKSTMIREIVLNTLETTEEKIGLFMLEEFVHESVTDMMGMKLKKRIDINPDLCTEEEKKEAWTELFADNRVVLSDAHSFSDLEDFMSKIRFMHHSYGIDMFFLDNLTKMSRLLVRERENENFVMSQIMTQLESLCKELSIYICLVSHVRKEDSQGRGYTEGKIMRVHDLYGSGDVSKSAYNVLAISRDNTENPNKTQYHLIATRRGKNGSGRELGFDFDTARLINYEDAVPLVDEDNEDEVGGSL